MTDPRAVQRVLEAHTRYRQAAGEDEVVAAERGGCCMVACRIEKMECPLQESTRVVLALPQSRVSDRHQRCKHRVNKSRRSHGAEKWHAA